MNPITNHDWWIMKVYQLEKRQKASRLVGMLWWSVWCATVLLGETLWPPPRDLNSLQTSCRRCSVWTFLKSINTGIHGGSGGLSERWRAVPQHDWDGHKIPQIRGCWANTPVGRGGGEEGRREEIGRKNRAGGREMSEDASQCFHVLPVLPLTRGFTLRNLPPVVLHSVLNWPYRWDLFAQKGDIWTGIIRGPDLRVSAKYSSLPEMFSAAKLLQKLWVGVYVAAGRAVLSVQRVWWVVRVSYFWKRLHITQNTKVTRVD